MSPPKLYLFIAIAILIKLLLLGWVSNEARSNRDAGIFGMFIIINGLTKEVKKFQSHQEMIFYLTGWFSKVLQSAWTLETQVIMEWAIQSQRLNGMYLLRTRASSSWMERHIPLCCFINYGVSTLYGRLSQRRLFARQWKWTDIASIT